MTVRKYKIMYPINISKGQWHETTFKGTLFEAKQYAHQYALDKHIPLLSKHITIMEII